MGAHDGSFTKVWGDGVHVFRLPIDQLLELEDIRKVGAQEIMDRLLTRRWYVQDVRQIVRLGLIGGGMAPQEAYARMLRYVDPPRPLIESLPLAIEIMGMAITGPVEDVPSGKAGAEVGKGSPPPPSMVQEPPTDSPPQKSGE